jgi:aryl-alcohol dehydrogenase-like predicted oxidoreductase
LAHDAVSTVIPGNVNIAQLTNNVESINNPISRELVEKLEEFYLNEVKQLNLPW